MNWDAIGAVAELLGAIAVFASLIYLATQIRHNSAIGRATIEQHGYDSHAKGLEALMYHPDISALQDRFVRGQLLNDDEMIRLHPFLLWVLDSHQNNFVQHRLGFLEDESYEAQWGRISRIYFNEPAIHWVMSNRGDYRPDFLLEIQNRLVAHDDELAALFRLD